MKTSRLLCTLGLLLSLSSISQASDFSLRISNDSVHAEARSFNESSEVGGGYIYHDGARHIAHINWHARGPLGSGSGANAGVGFKAIAFKDEPIEGFALALGGTFELAASSQSKLSFLAGAHYAPDILSAGDSKKMLDLNIQANYKLVPNAAIFIGYHHLKTKLEAGPNVQLNDGVFLGIRLAI